MDVTKQFEEARRHLQGVAYRMLGSLTEADDAVQETWLRLSKSDTSEVDNLQGWLTTVVARVCLDMLRKRKARREEGQALSNAEALAEVAAPSPEQEALLADSVGLALLVVLDTLDPAERLAFVLHDLFGVSFDEVAAIVGRSPAAARQLASRARRRVQGAPLDDTKLASQRPVVDAFLAALRTGDFDALVQVLDPDVVAHARRPDGTAVDIRGAVNWAKGAVHFTQAAASVHAAIIGDSLGVVFAPKGKVLRALQMRIENDKIVEVDIITEPDRLDALEISLL